MIALIGAGNVATWLVEKLQNSKEFPIGQVYSRHLENAKTLAEKVGAEPIDDLHQLNPACDLFVFALKDDAYPQIFSNIPFKMSTAVLTAGSVSQNVLKPFAEQYGVVYPLQTFSKNTDMSDLKVPICIENSCLGEKSGMVERFAAELSDKCCFMNESQRFATHLAAVFACNFSNAVCGMADEILRENDLDFDVLLPLLQQTMSKLDTLSPEEAQTGPAVRGDMSVMNKHLDALDDEKKEVYHCISNYIAKKRK